MLRSFHAGNVFGCPGRCGRTFRISAGRSGTCGWGAAASNGTRLTHSPPVTSGRLKRGKCRRRIGFAPYGTFARRSGTPVAPSATEFGGSIQFEVPKRALLYPPSLLDRSSAAPLVPGAGPRGRRSDRARTDDRPYLRDARTISRAPWTARHPGQGAAQCESFRCDGPSRRGRTAADFDA